MTTTPERSATLTDLVAAEIRAQMGRLNVRQRELARRLGENDQWVSTRVNGRTPINLNELHRFAQALEVGVYDLLPPPERINDRKANLVLPVSPTYPISRSGRHSVSGISPLGSGRRDSVRPVSAVPASKRRPAPMGPGNRPIPA